MKEHGYWEHSGAGTNALDRYKVLFKKTTGPGAFLPWWELVRTLLLAVVLGAVSNDLAQTIVLQTLWLAWVAFIVISVSESSCVPLCACPNQGIAGGRYCVPLTHVGTGRVRSMRTTIESHTL